MNEFAKRWSEMFFILREVDSEVNFRQRTWVEFFHTYESFRELQELEASK